MRPAKPPSWCPRNRSSRRPRASGGGLPIVAGHSFHASSSGEETNRQAIHREFVLGSFGPVEAVPGPSRVFPLRSGASLAPITTRHRTLAAVAAIKGLQEESSIGAFRTAAGRPPSPEAVVAAVLHVC